MSADAGCPLCLAPECACAAPAPPAGSPAPLPESSSPPPDPESSPPVVAARVRRRPRPRTISGHSTRAEQVEAALHFGAERAVPPATRGECAGGPRPCPFVACRHHLYLDVSDETGSIRLNFPDLEVWEMTESCSLDVADRGEMTLEEIGVALNLTRERIRQVEVRGLMKLKGELPDDVDDD